jgi:hypothetical protein
MAGLFEVLIDTSAIAGAERVIAAISAAAHRMGLNI